MASAPWTPPDPFISTPSTPAFYYARYNEEIMREVSYQASVLGLTAPAWFRYHNEYERSAIAPNLGSSLVGFPRFQKSDITDIRDVYEGTSAHTGLFSAWDTTKREYLEAKYDTAPYSSWVHSASTLGKKGDLYDRDLDELRSYAFRYNPANTSASPAHDITGDGIGDGIGGPEGGYYRVVAGDCEEVYYYKYSFRGIVIYPVADLPTIFHKAFLVIRQNGYEGNPWTELGDLNLDYFSSNVSIVQKEHYEVESTFLQKISPMTNGQVVFIDIKRIVEKAKGKDYLAFKLYFDIARNNNAKDDWVQFGVPAVQGPHLCFFNL